MEEAETIVNSVLSNLNDLSEDLGDTVKAAVGSPIKFIKVKNNLKKWAKFKLDMAAVDMDAIRKKEASGEDPKGIDKEKLNSAVKSKKEAIKGKMNDINDRLNDLAVNASLKAVVSLGKHKASLEANTKLLKIAQGEENDALKLDIEGRIEADKEAITTAEDQLKTYAKKAKEEPEAKKSEETDAGTPAANTSSEEDGNTEDDNSKVDGLKSTIKELETKSSDYHEQLISDENADDQAKLKELSIAKAKNDIELGNKKLELGKLEKIESEEEDKIKKSIEDAKAALTKAEGVADNVNIPEIPKINESLSSDISTKFRDLMNKMK